MALTQVTGPYPIFTDLDGTPLDDGYLYIGAINQDPEQNPIQVFWNANLTIPATQPIRTSNGYAYRNGTPALLYTGGEFSITIRNKREEFVLYSPVGYGFDPAAVSASVVKNDFIGNGVQVDFVLSASPSTILATNVFINGVYQEKDSYTLSGNVITFSIAPPLNSSIEVMTNETGVINSGNATSISYTASFPGATAQTVQAKLEQYVSVKDFGAVGDGVTNDTAAIQAALNSGKHGIYLPEGTYLFSALTVNQNTRVYGASTRTSILKHTGAGVAITCVHSGAVEPDGNLAYIEGGWFIFEDLELLVNGTVGFDVGNTRSSYSNWERVFIRHRLDGGTYFAGSVAIKCDNNPAGPTDATFVEKLDKVFIRGFETGVLLNATVNAWELNRVWMIEVKDQISINSMTGLNVIGCYFESGLAGARGIVFGASGGNAVTLVGSTIELTNLGATQYAYDFTAGGTWEQITAVSVKYLIAGDGNGVNVKRINGTAPDTFVELNRSYSSVTYGTVPMLWGPGVDASMPFQLPNTIRSGGFQQGQGKILLGRNDGDASDFALAYDATSNWSLTNSNNVKWLTGSGSPQSVVTAAPGSLYTNTQGGATVTLWVKESGTGNTGWVQK